MTLASEKILYGIVAFLVQLHEPGMVAAGFVGANSSVAAKRNPVSKS
jgi:hypothetical protein